MNKNYCAVITGDVVKSSSLSNKRAQWTGAIKNAIHLLKHIDSSKKEELIFSGFFRGDSFQYLVKEPSLALTYSLILKAELRRRKTPFMPIDIRQGIGIGDVQYLNKSSVQESDGSAFRHSGRALDEMKSFSRFSILTPSLELNKKWAVLTSLLDAILQKWTDEQAEAVSFWLRSKKQREIAHELNIKQPAVQRRLQLAGHFAIKKMLMDFKNDIHNYNPEKL